MDTPCYKADKSFFASVTEITVGDGRVINFWYDAWGDSLPPCQAWPNVHAFSRQKNRSLHDALHDGTWIQDLQGRVTAALLPDFVDLRARALGVVLTPSQCDGVRWKSASGTYSLADAYHRQFLGIAVYPLRFA